LDTPSAPALTPTPAVTKAAAPRIIGIIKIMTEKLLVYSVL
jgi:hypothetical protein